MTIEQDPPRRVELNWFDYFCQRADFDRVHVLVLIQVDLTFATRASDPTFDASKADTALTWCTTMRVPLRDPEAFAGMASAAEADLLDLLADRLEAAANAYAPGILGRLRGRTPTLTPWPEPVAGDNSDSPRYGVTAHITHLVTRMSLGIYVVGLALEAAHHGGTYEGWGTMVSEGSSAAQRAG